LHLLLPAGFYRRFLCVCLRLIFHIVYRQQPTFMEKILW
jgi:hypothetical protein